MTTIPIHIISKLRSPENKRVLEAVEELRAHGQLSDGTLKNIVLIHAHLEGADLIKVNLEGAELWKANLKGAELLEANLKNAELIRANLQGADLTRANLNGVDFWKTDLKGAKLIAVIVNAETFIWGCEFDLQTDFTGMRMDLARIEPRMKESLRTKVC